MNASPSPATLARATLGALVAAAVVLVTVVLPAEYGIDPTGIGEALGLVVLSAEPVTPLDTPVRQDGLTDQPETYHLDRRTLVLGPREFVELKYRLEAGQAFVYSWETTAAVRSEMHSDPDGDGRPVEFFEIVEDVTGRNGSYVAPFSGMHGWYWLNETADSVSITIDAAGFFRSGTEYRASPPPVEYEIVTPQGSVQVPAGERIDP